MSGKLSEVRYGERGDLAETRPNRRPDLDPLEIERVPYGARPSRARRVWRFDWRETAALA